MKLNQSTLVNIIDEQTRRALWEVKNVIDCVPDDLWYINPRDNSFQEPSVHEKDLNNLDVVTDKKLSREEINHYFHDIEKKILGYISELDDAKLSEYPAGCEYSRFTLILAQFRHLHTHMGMIWKISVIC